MKQLKLPLDGLMVIGVLSAAYLLFNFVFPGFLNAFVSTYIMQPVIWGLIIWMIIRLPRYKGAGKLKIRSMLVKLALAIGAFQVYLAFVAGFFDKFGKSPNSFTVKGIIINIIFVGAGLIGAEFSRAWLINCFARGKTYIITPVCISVFYTLFALPPGQISAWGETLEQNTQFLGSTLLPLFSEHMMASFLALWGGPLPSLAYRGLLAAVNWFCPVLPSLNWAMKALTGTVVPIVGLIIVQQFAMARLNPAKFRRESGRGLAGWVILSAMGILLLWFSLGVFPIRPTVIISGSMRPGIEIGDIAIVAKTNPGILKIGDIVQYRQLDSPIPIVHRIIDIQPYENKQMFITKGDNNKTEDTLPVQVEQIIGKAVFVVPKAGWATIAVKNLFESKSDLKEQEERINGQ